MHTHEDPSKVAAFLRGLRDTLQCSAAELGALVHVSGRTMEAWLSGARLMPIERFELLAAKLEKLGRRKDGVELIVVLRRAHPQDAPWPADVVAKDAFLGLRNLGGGRHEIASLAIDPMSGRPYVKRTSFEDEINAHVIRTSQTWYSLVNEYLAPGQP